MMKRPDRSPSVHESSPLAKPDRVLFRPLELPRGSDPAAASQRPLVPASPADLEDTNKEIAAQWAKIRGQFAGTDKLDFKSVISYWKGEEKALDERCAHVCAFFDLVIQTLGQYATSLSGKTVREELLKIYVIVFRQVSVSLQTLVLFREENEPSAVQDKELSVLLSQRGTLNDFLLLLMQDRKNGAVLGQYDVSLMQVVGQSVSQLHDRLLRAKKLRNPSAVAAMLHRDFESAAILAGFNECRMLTKAASCDCIRFAFEMLERGLRTSVSVRVFKELYSQPLESGEEWTEGPLGHVRLATRFGKKKLAVVKLGTGSAGFSLRYISAYYALKLVQLLIAKKAFHEEEKMMETVAMVLKDTDETLGRAGTAADLVRIELALNENLVCFNIIKRVLPVADDPFVLLDKLGYIQTLKGALETHMAAALRLRLVAFNCPVGQPVEEAVSYKKTHDYVAGAFGFLNHLKNMKSSRPLKSTSKSSKGSVSVMTEERVGDIISTIDSAVSSEPELLVLKTYLVEYLFDNRHVVSRQTAEHIIRLIGSVAFHFTSPADGFKDLEPGHEAKPQDELEKLNSRRIAMLLSETIAYDKAWAEIILKHMMEQVMVLYRKEEHLFGLYKLIYCVLTHEVHDNVSFSQTILKNWPEELTYARYSQCEHLSEDKAVQAFIDVKGIAGIVGILQLTYKAIMLQAQNVDGTKPISIAVQMTEQLFLRLNDIPAVAEQTLSQPALVGEFLECLSLGPHIQRVIVSLLQKLLANVKYGSGKVAVPGSPDRTAYLPLRLLDFVTSRAKPGRPELTGPLLPILDLLVSFVVPEPGLHSISVHQAVLNSNGALAAFFQIVRDNQYHQTVLRPDRSTPLVGKLLGALLSFTGGLQYQNDSVAAEVSDSPLVARKGLYRFLKDCVNQEVEHTLGLLFQVTFEAAVDLARPARFIIKRPFFLVICLALLSLLATKPEWKKRVAAHCVYMIEAIQNSYWNYTICARGRVFRQIIKLMRRFGDGPETLSAISGLATNAASVNTSSQCMKSIIAELAVYNDPRIDPAAKQARVLAVVDFLQRALSAESHREVFSFSGKPGCGIGLLARKSLPSKGYCFCGWIRVERADQSMSGTRGKMTVFKLGASKSREIELFVRDGFLHYSMADIKAKEQVQVTTFSQRRVEEDRWYFVELYHLNNESPKSLILYLNSELVKEGLSKPYQAKLDNDENTIGCGVLLEYVSKEGYEKITNCFCGEMGALYFLEVAPDSVAAVHSTLSYASVHIGMEELVHTLSVPGHRTKDAAIIDRIFMQVNPKYTGKISQAKQRLYVCYKGKTAIDVFNSVESLYKEVRIDHNVPAKEVFLNIGGLKPLMPLLYQLAEGSSQRDFAYSDRIIASPDRNCVAAKVMEIAERLVRLDHQRASVFFEAEEGLLVLRYLLERVLGLKPNSARLREAFFLATLDECYPTLSEPYTEMLLLNGDLWSYSPPEVQLAVVEKVSTRFAGSILDTVSKILDAFLSMLEIYINQDKDNSPVIQKLVAVIARVLRNNLTEENVNILMGYANLYYVRRLPNYWMQLYHVLRILLDLYLSCHEKLVKSIKTVVKAKRDSKVLSTLAVVLQYCLDASDAKENLDYLESASVSEDDKCADSRQNEGLYPRSAKKETVIDAVQAVAMFVLGGFDWPVFADLVKDFAKEDAAASTPNQQKAGTVSPALAATQTKRMQRDVVGLLVKSLSKHKGTESLVLEAFFSDAEVGKKAVGVATYLAMSALALGGTDRLEKCYDIESAASNAAPPAEKHHHAIRSLPVYEFMLRQATKRFTPDACLELVGDLSAMWDKLAKEIGENLSVLIPIFELSGVSEDPRLAHISAELLCSLPPATQGQVWAHMRGSAVYQASVLSESISLASVWTGPDKHPEKPMVKCTLYAYAVEDVLANDSTVARSKEFLLAAARLVLMADRLDMMYTSVPTLAWMDERLLATAFPKEEHESAIVQREGSVLRVLFKALLMAAKFDATPDVSSIKLIRYLLFRDRTDRKAVKQCFGIGRDKSGSVPKAKSKSKRPARQKYSLIDLVFKRDPDAVKQHSGISEFYLKKSIWNDTSVLDPRRIQKSAPALAKEANFFEQPHTMMMYILCELFHLMHFELLGVTSYKKMSAVTAAVMAKTSEAYRSHQKIPSGKYRCLLQILGDIVKSDTKGELPSVVLGNLDKFAEVLRPRLQSYLPDNGLVNLGNTWSVLDLEPTGRKESGELKLKWELVEDPKAKQTDGLEKVRRKWHELFKSFVGMMRTDPEMLSTMLLRPEVVSTVQPYILLLTGNQFCRLDQSIAESSAKRKLGSSRRETLEVARFRQELTGKVRAKFDSIGIPKSKIERDELRQDFDVLAGSVYRRLQKEQESEVGAWFSRRKEREYGEMFGYIEGKYRKLLRRCPLYQHLRSNTLTISNRFGEFVALSGSRDPMDRAMKLKRFSKLTENQYVGNNFSYVRWFIAKKFMLIHLLRKEQRARINLRELFKGDFEFELVRRVFPPKREPKKTPSTSAKEEPATSLAAEPVLGEMSPDQSRTQDPAAATNMDEYIPKSKLRRMN